MKKKYIAPSTQVINIQPSRMIASSVNAISGADGLTNGGNTYDSGITEAGSKGRGGYDDDWTNIMW